MKIITISREFGSGGRELGKRLADELQFAYYDKEILTEVARQSGMDEQYTEKIMSMERLSQYPVTHTYGRSFSIHAALQRQHDQTELLLRQQQILKDLAAEDHCVIVGRGADIILGEYHPLNLFVYADMSAKTTRCRKYAGENENLTLHELQKKIQQIDSGRKQYYALLKGSKWGAKENYHLCINTSGIEIAAIISPLAAYAAQWFGGIES